ncbi:MAG TPA: amidase [Streptosporangiaceae bacterium]|nr:amidase [Streptosporangiaceae bacterium]
MSDVTYAGAAVQAELLAAREVSAKELVDLALARIDATQDTIGAFRVVRHEAARAEAAEADRRLAAGERLPLLGVPVAIKDDMDLTGETTPFGCAGDHVPKLEDSEIVRRLRTAGAIIMGKTRTSELGQWPTSESTAYGVARNPWSLAHTPGGSSGGSAAAVATGMVAAAVGSDGLGSIRIPAAWTSLVGLKPQRGRISAWPIADPFYGLTVYGPLTRSVRDAALLLEVLSGGHEGDRHRPARPFAPADPGRGPVRLRVALSFRTPFGVPSAVDPEIRAAVERLAGVLAGLGHDVFPADPDYGLIGLGVLPRGAAGISECLARIPNARPDRRTRTEVRLGRVLGRPLLPVALRAEARHRRRVARVFDRADVVLTPTTALPPLRIGALDDRGWLSAGRVSAAVCPFAWAWNVLGWPAVSVPAGFTAAGLPIGAQFLGPDCEEATLLALAAQLEAVEGWTSRTPPSVGGRPDVGAPA